MTFLLLACIGLQSVPKGQRADEVGHDPNEGVDTAAPLDTATDGNSEPYADAGGNLIGLVGAVVNLDGAGSYDPDGDGLDFAWSIDAAPTSSSVKLSGATQDVAQLVPDVSGAWDIALVVSDGVLESAADVITLTVTENNGSPVAAAAADQTVAFGATVALDGSGSSDPDGDPLQYAWTLATRPATSAATLSSSTSARPTFVADAAGIYEATLVVSDGTQASGPDRVRVVAQGSGGGGGSSSSCLCQSASTSPPLGLAIVLALAGTQIGRSRRSRG